MKLLSTTTGAVPSVMPAADVRRSESGAGAAGGASSGMTAAATVVFGTGTESQGSDTATIVPVVGDLVATGAAAARESTPTAGVPGTAPAGLTPRSGVAGDTKAAQLVMVVLQALQDLSDCQQAPQCSAHLELMLLQDLKNLHLG